MSYVRWGEEGSSLYLFANAAGHVECCWCRFETREVEPYTDMFGITQTVHMGSAALHTPEEVITHLRKHQTAGDTVPAYLFDAHLYKPDDFQLYREDSHEHA